MLDKPRESATIQVACPSCGGQGRIRVTHEMAVDAGDLSMEGAEWGCSNCNGDGWILEEVSDAKP